MPVICTLMDICHRPSGVNLSQGRKAPLGGFSGSALESGLPHLVGLVSHRGARSSTTTRACRQIQSNVEVHITAVRRKLQDSRQSPSQRCPILQIASVNLNAGIIAYRHPVNIYCISIVQQHDIQYDRPRYQRSGSDCICSSARIGL